MLSQKDISNIFLSLLRKGGKGIFGETAGRLSDEEWEALYQFGLQTGLSPAFYKRLCDLKSENIPPAFFSKFKNCYLLNLKLNIRMEQELFKILGRFNASGIRAIPLKGPVLSRLLYEDAALRSGGCDLDILMEKNRLSEAEEILMHMGYVFSSGKQSADFHHKFREQITLQKKAGGQSGAFVDLHWGLRDRFTPTHLKELWAGARQIDLDGQGLLVPSNEDLLIYLVLLAISDFDFVQIKYLHDLRALVAKSGNAIDWDRASATAKKHGLDSAFFFALKLSRELFAAPVPEAALRAVRPHFIKKRFLGLWINKRNVLEFRARIASTYTWRHFLSSYALSKNVFTSLRTIFEKVFLPMDEVMTCRNTRANERPFFIYINRLLRPIRLSGGRRIRIH